ncbi:MAG: translocation/assembly module TamB domain-containing protein [Deltaproteobacteria bacterium]|nr:translocation/assembly module TamB domain-containing protein [Deltaproteobacteria bacterium]
MKRVARFVSAAILLIVLLAVLSAAGLHFYLMTERGSSRALALLNSLIPGDIRAESTALSLFGQAVVLSGAELVGPDGGVILTSDEVRVEIDVLPLVNNRLVFNLISLKRPYARLAMSGDTRQLNLVQAFVEEPAEREPSTRVEQGDGSELIIENLSVENGLIQYADPSSGIAARLEGVNARSSLNLARLSGNLDGSLARAGVQAGGETFELTTVRIDAAYDDGSVDPLFLEASYNGFRASVRGAVADLAGRPLADIVVEYGGEISGLAALLDPGRAYSGKVSGRMNARGEIGNPEASVILKYEGGTIAGMPVEGLVLEASIENRVVQLRESLLRIASGRAAATGAIHLEQVFPKGFIESDPDLEAVSYEIGLTLEDIDITRFSSGRLEDYPDSVSGRVEIAGKGIRPPGISAKADYVLRFRGMPPGFPIPADALDIRGEAGIDYPILTYTAAGGISGDIGADVRGRLNLSDGGIRAAVNVDIKRIETIAAPLDIQAKGTLAARAEISGTLDSPVAEGSLQGKNLEWGGYLIGTASADLRLEESGMLNLTALRMNEAGPSLAVKGRLKIFRKGFDPEPDMPVSLDIGLRSVAIDRLIAQEGMGGTLNGDVGVGGTLGSPAVVVDLAGEDITVRGVNMGNIRIQGGLAGEGKAVPPAALRNDGAGPENGGTEKLPEGKGPFDPRLDFEITGERLNLQGLTSLAEGALGYHVLIGGSLYDLRGTFRAGGKDIALAGQALQEVSAAGALKGRRIALQSLTAVVWESQIITGSGSIDLDGDHRYDFSLSTEGIMLGALTSFQGSQVTGGRLVFEASGSGTLREPRLEATVRVASPVVQGQVLNDVAIGLSMAGGVMDITGQNDFVFKGAYDPGKKTVDIQAYFEETELAPYFAIAGRPEFRGKLSGSAEITGAVSDLEDLDISLHIAGIRLGFRERELMRASGVMIQYKEGTLIIPESRVELPGQGVMTIRADAAAHGRLDLTARGKVPLEVAALIDPDLADITGTAGFDISAVGPFSSPRIEGQVLIEDARYPIPYNDQLLHDVRGRITLGAEGIVIETLAGRLDQGYFDIRGRMDLEDLKPGRISLQAQVRSLPVLIPETMDLVLEGRATLTGMPDKSLLQADITILDALYYREHQLNLIAEVGQRIIGGGKRSDTAPASLDLPYLRNAELDVTILKRGDVLVENNLAELSIAPDLQVGGTLNSPIITGRVAVIEGFITYQRRTFDVTLGVLEFADPYRTSGAVDLQAQGQVRDWMIYISVSGPFDNLNIRLESDPALEDAAILALLATGRTPDELTGVGALGPRSPSSMLAELLAGTYGEELRETTGLDILELETVSPEAGGAAGNIRITVGEELTRRLTVKYSLETTSGETTRTAIAEYKFFENLLINGFQDNKGAFGADLRFRLEFR